MMGLLCRVFGHNAKVTGKVIQDGWRWWQYCARCHIRLSPFSEVRRPA